MYEDRTVFLLFRDERGIRKVVEEMPLLDHTLLTTLDQLRYRKFKK
jgi:hypothetical protein